jgi:hypothetical protein
VGISTKNTDKVSWKLKNATYLITELYNNKITEILRRTTAKTVEVASRQVKKCNLSNNTTLQ